MLSLYRCSLTRSLCAPSSTRQAVVSLSKQQQQQQHRAFSRSLKEANETMASYHEARQAMKQGKLKSKSPSANNSSAGYVQFAIAGVFVISFLCTPILGKKIAQDEEFRKKYIPSWYDYTVRKPENAWTRQELHEQMVQVQQEVRERAIRGDFAPEKLEEMQANLDQVTNRVPPKNGKPVPAGWNSVHPGAGADGESRWNED